MEVVASLSQGRTAAAQCGLFTYKSVPVIFEPPCICLWSYQTSKFITILLPSSTVTQSCVISSDELFYSTVIISQLLAAGDYFCFRVAKTNHNRSATNSSHMITNSVRSLLRNYTPSKIGFWKSWQIIIIIITVI